MIETREVIAVFVEDTGAAKCGYCGKTLCFIERKQKKIVKNTKNTQKSIDKQNFSAIIDVKCGRCNAKNTIQI